MEIKNNDYNGSTMKSDFSDPRKVNGNGERTPWSV